MNITKTFLLFVFLLLLAVVAPTIPDYFNDFSLYLCKHVVLCECDFSFLLRGVSLSTAVNEQSHGQW